MDFRKEILRVEGIPTISERGTGAYTKVGLRWKWLGSCLCLVLNYMPTAWMSPSEVTGSQAIFELVDGEEDRRYLWLVYGN